MKPRVLLLYYSFTHQTRRVAEAMAESFHDCGCETVLCPIEFTDHRYPMQFPFKPFLRTILGWVVPQLLGRVGQVSVPQEIVEQHFELICIGSPTWWLKPAMPIVSFLNTNSARRLLDGRSFAVFVVCRALWRFNLSKVRKLASKQGGHFIRGAAFCFQGNQVQSMLSFINYLKTGADRERCWGVKLFKFGVPQDGLDKAKAFARELAETLDARA